MGLGSTPRTRVGRLRHSARRCRLYLRRSTTREDDHCDAKGRHRRACEQEKPPTGTSVQRLRRRPIRVSYGPNCNSSFSLTLMSAPLAKPSRRRMIVSPKRADAYLLARTLSMNQTMRLNQTMRRTVSDARPSERLRGRRGRLASPNLRRKNRC